jgi:histidine triad (HIT) family protein
MKKKWTLLVTLFVSTALGGYYFFAKGVLPSTESDCPFCNQEVLERQTFYEDESVLALYTHKPYYPGHCLIIPKRHVERFEGLSDIEVLQMGQVIKKVNEAVKEVYGTSAYLLLQKNGREVGQSVFHVHFHYVPKKGGEASITEFAGRMFLANASPPISREEMARNVSKLKEAMTY